MQKTLIFLLVLLCLNTPNALAEEFTVVPATAQHLQLMREGGLVLFIRHGPTDSSQPDKVPVDLNDCHTQRPLSDEGRLLMADVGQAIQKASIPIGSIFSSPLCRAVETSELLFGANSFEIEQNLLYVAALTTAEKQPIIAKTKILLSDAVSAGENRILVAHGPNLVEVMDYFPVEGTVVIIRPLPDAHSFEYIASIEPSHWPQLLSGLE